MFYAAITDKAPVARRNVADVVKCDGCHDQLNGHGNNRVGSVQMCATCHNPNATDVRARANYKVNGVATPINWTNPDPVDKRGEQTIDLKVMIHAIHAAPDIAGYAAFAGFTYTPYVVYHNGRPHQEQGVNGWALGTPFPTPAGSGPGGGPTINHCTGCHIGTTYYPPDPSTSPALPTATRTDATPAATTAGAAVCSSCHVTSTAMNHMTQNGGSFTAQKDPVTGKQVGGSQESCVVCHAAGAIEDVAVVHKLSSFQ
jgi:OmcA/MtrC family decaheme c-type cytochrome